MRIRHIAIVAMIYALLPVQYQAFAACEEYPASSGVWYPGSYASQSLAASDVASCISSASSGDVVILTSGNVDWSAGGVMVNKPLTISGRTTGCPVACDSGTKITVGTAVAFTVTASDFRITGITFEGNGATNGSVYINAGGASSATNWRIDHCHFKDTTARGISVGAYASASGYGADFPGLIDSCLFSATNRFKAVEIYGGSITAHGSWDDTLSLGGSDFLFIEDNSFVHTSMPDGGSSIDGDTGARIVIRNNAFVNGDISTHGQEECSDISAGVCAWKSTHGWEVYNNAFTYDTAHSFVLNMRGGTGVIYDNTITGTESAFKPIRYLYERGDLERTCLDAGACQGESTYDGNEVGKYGYLCYQQLGATGPSGIVSMPIYQWSNTYNGVASESDMSEITYEAACNYQHVQFGRDVILNGSTTKPSYTPYTYPHHLRGTYASLGTGSKSRLSPGSSRMGAGSGRWQ